VVERLHSKASPNDPLTAHLHKGFTRLWQGQTVGEALDWLRANPPKERIVYFYVVDQDDRLCGVVPTRRLLLSAPTTPVCDILLYLNLARWLLG
jgi:magnesium transporter